MINKPVGQTVDLPVTSLSLEQEGLRFKSRDSHIGHGVANSSPPLQHFFKRSYVAQMQEHGDAEMGPTKLSHALEYWYSKYDKMKDLKNMITDTKVLHSICSLCFFSDQSFNQS